MTNITEAERTKYEELWTDVPEYRDYSPGMENVQRFCDILHPPQECSLIDVGCGTGIAGLAFRADGHEVWWLDITNAALHPHVPRDRFLRYAVWEDWAYSRFDYGFCCDVMEHIPTEYTMLAASRIIKSCDVSWFQIAFRDDQFGRLIGKPLHLTVQSFEWWLQRLRTLGDVVEARDLIECGLFVVESRR